MPDTAPTTEDRLRLTAHPLLHDLDGDAREALLDLFRVEEVPGDHHFLEEGQSNDRLFVILKGAVSVRLPRKAERISEVKLATLEAGDLFGEYSIFDGQPVSAAVYAIGPARVAWLPKRDIDAFAEGRREKGRRFHEAIIRLLIARLRRKDAELDYLTIG